MDATFKTDRSSIREEEGEVNQQEQLELIQLAKSGDNQALIQVLKSIEPSIYKTAFYFMGNEHDAKDVTQDALMKVYTKLHTFQEKAQFKTWVQRITTNLCMDYFRKKREEISIEGSELPLSLKENLEEDVETKLMLEEVIVEINLLSPPLKAVMILRYLHEFSYQEIATALDIPLNTVKSHLYRGRDHLQAVMIKKKGGVH